MVYEGINMSGCYERVFDGVRVIMVYQGINNMIDIMGVYLCKGERGV